MQPCRTQRRSLRVSLEPWVRTAPSATHTWGIRSWSNSARKNSNSATTCSNIARTSNCWSHLRNRLSTLLKTHLIWPAPDRTSTSWWAATLTLPQMWDSNRLARLCKDPATPAPRLSKTRIVPKWLPGLCHLSPIWWYPESAAGSRVDDQLEEWRTWI